MGTGGEGEVAEGRRKEEKKGKVERHSTKASEKKDDTEHPRICYPYQMEEGSSESIHDTHTQYIICINSI